MSELAQNSKLIEERERAYDRIDRFLRNNMDDEDYAGYSSDLDAVYAAPPAPAQTDSDDLTVAYMCGFERGKDAAKTAKMLPSPAPEGER